jgi:hypothetical protein
MKPHQPRKRKKQDKEIKINLADRLIPRVEGVYAVQALAYDGLGSDFGVYRKTIRQSEQWVRGLVPAGRYEWFLLREDEFWRIYDHTGAWIAHLLKLPGRAREECKNRIVVDREGLNLDAMITTGRNDLKCLAVLEHHAGVSCADQDNYVQITRQLVSVADEQDLNHIFIVESREWPCRVAGLFAEFPNLSQNCQEKYLQYQTYLSQSKPLYTTGYSDLLARRLARGDYKEFAQALRRMFEKAELEVDGSYMVDLFLNAPLKRRQIFIRMLLELQKYNSDPDHPESVDLNFLKYHAAFALTLGRDALENLDLY